MGRPQARACINGSRGKNAPPVRKLEPATLMARLATGNDGWVAVDRRNLSSQFPNEFALAEEEVPRRDQRAGAGLPGAVRVWLWREQGRRLRMAVAVR
jgi:hypothetical protein